MSTKQTPKLKVCDSQNLASTRLQPLILKIAINFIFFVSTKIIIKNLHPLIWCIILPLHLSLTKIEGGNSMF